MLTRSQRKFSGCVGFVGATIFERKLKETFFTRATVRKGFQMRCRILAHFARGVGHDQ